MYTNNTIATYEGYYAAVFYAYFVSAGLDVRVEDSTSRGRLDMAVRFDGSVVVLEFKVVGAGRRWDGDGAAPNEGLCGQIPGPRRVRGLGRRRVQQYDAQHRRVRRVAGML